MVKPLDYLLLILIAGQRTLSHCLIYLQYYSKKLGSVVFLFFIYLIKIKQISSIVQYYNLKKLSFIFVITKLNFQKPLLQMPVFSVTWSYRNHSNMQIWCSRNISYQCWKQLCCSIFLWKAWHIVFRIFWWIENRKSKRNFKLKSVVTL